MKDKDSKDKFSELRRRAEVAAVEKSLGVSDVSALSPEKVQQLIHELQVHQIELEMQNEELRQTQLTLEASRHKYSELYDFAPVGYFTLDQNGVILESNLTGANLFGVERGLLIGKPLASFVNDENGNALYLHFRQVLETQSKQTCDIRLTKQDGSQIPVRLDSLIVKSQDGSSTVLRTAIIDIPRRREAEAELKESEERFRLLYENVSLGYQSLDENGCFLEVNRVWLDMLGYSREEVIGKWFGDFLAPGYRERFKTNFPKFKAAGESHWAEFEMISKDGSLITFGLDGQVGRDGRGQFRQTHCILHDISEIKRSEEALRESEQQYRRLFEDAPLMYVITRNEQGVPFVSDCNELFLRSVGYPREEAVGQPLANFYSPESRSDLLGGGGYAQALAGEFFIGERQLLTRDGRLIATLLYTATESDPSGQVIGTRSMFVDITERKKAERAVKWAENFLNTIVDNLPIAVFAKSAQDGQFILWNKASEALFGFTKEQVIGKTDYDFFPKEQADFFWEKDRETFASGEIINIREEPILTKHSVTRMLHTRKVPVYDKERRPSYLLAISEDITERKRVEEALRESEQRFRAIFENIELGVTLIDSDHNIVMANTTFGKWFDKPSSEFTGKKCFREFDKRDTICPHCPGVQAIAGGQAAEAEIEVIRSDGTPGNIWMRAFPTFGSEGTATGFIEVVEDITERRKAEQALKESEQQYRTLFEESRDGVYSVLRDGEITDANPAFCELFGYSREEMIGKDIRELYVDPTVGPKFQEEIEKKGFVKDYEVNWQNRNGTEVDCLLTSSVIFGEDGSIAGYRGIARDLTAGKELHRQLLQAQKMEAVGTLAGGIAHDFNNLLTIVMGFSELLLAEKDQKHPEYADLQKIFHAAKSGAELVQRLLMFSRKSEPKPVLMNLNKQIVQVEKLLRHTIPKMVDIHLDLSADLAEIHADPSQVEQVLMNLAVNARDAMPDGGKLTVSTQTVMLDEEYCRLHVVGATPGDHVLLKLSDTGQGMDKETVEHIFEPFFTTKEIGRGTGLGLAMVYGIVSQHNGHITVYSEVRKGTTFRVYLPAVPSDVEPNVEASGIMPAFGTETVLLVDDEEFVRELGTRILTKHGYTVIEAADGREALDLFKKERSQISLVILDLIMPEMGGTECLKELLKIDPQVNVLVASGYSADTSIRESIDMGAKGFVTKPFRVNELLREVRKMLDES